MNFLQLSLFICRTQSTVTYRPIFILQERTCYHTVLQQDFPSLAWVPFTSFIFVIQQLVWGQHKPACLPVLYNMTLWRDPKLELKLLIMSHVPESNSMKSVLPFSPEILLEEYWVACLYPCSSVGSRQLSLPVHVSSGF